MSLGYRILVWGLCLTMLQGCMTTRSQMNNAGTTPDTSDSPVGSAHADDPDLPKMANEELDRIPVEINPMVEKWISYFQGRGRHHMERYLARMPRYSKVMKKILRQNGLPEDLIYIALIESGFSSHATSHASAVGYWQFIRPTGRRYGLEINALVDERRDPILATQAAAEYFKGLYSVFGSWYLAMASYNSGENRVKRRVMDNMTRDFWELARKRKLPNETINYVPKYIAAKLIGNNPEQYGFTDIDPLPPIEFDHITVESPVNLRRMAQAMNFDYDDLKSLNPKFKGEVAPLKGTKLELRIPVGQQAVALAAAQSSFVDKVEFVADSGDTQIYRVRAGDSLYSIAKRHRTTVAWLRDVNDIKPGKKLRIGARLQVPDRSAGRSTTTVARAQARPARASNSDQAAESKPEVTTSAGTFYIVQRGDTLSGIAEEYDSSIEELRRMNRMNRRSVLRAGQRLRVPKVEALPSEPVGVARRANSPARQQRNVANSGARSSSGANSASSIRHVVRRGENLTVIARRYGVSVQQIRVANRMNNRSVLKTGAVLVIPQAVQSRAKRAPKYHVVRRGENLSQIAGKYNVSLANLKRQNDIKNPSLLFVGSRLMIPSAQAR